MENGKFLRENEIVVICFRRSFEMNLANTFGPWYTFARYFGYFPHGLYGENRSRISAVFSILVTVVLVVVNLALHGTLWPMVGRKFESFFTTTIGYRIERIYNWLDSVAPIIVTLLNFAFFKRVKKIFTDLEAVDKLFVDINLHMEYRQQRRYTQKFLILLIFLNLCFPILFPVNDDLEFRAKYDEITSIALGAYIFYRQLSYLSFLGTVIVLLLGVYLRFKAINIYLFGKFLGRQGDVGEFLQLDLKKRTDSVVIVNTLAMIYQRLTEIVDQINVAFSFQVSYNLIQ